MVWPVYAALVPLLVFVGLVMWRSVTPPAISYVVFAAVGAALLLVVLVDTGWTDRLARLPMFQAGGQTYRVLAGQQQQIEDVRNFQGQIAATLGIPTPQRPLAPIIISIGPIWTPTPTPGP